MTAGRTDEAPARSTATDGGPGGWVFALTIGRSTDDEPGLYAARMKHVDGAGYGMTHAEAAADWERVALAWLLQYHEAARALAARTRGPE